MPSSRVSKTIAEKFAVIAWIEEHSNGIPTQALKHFCDELNWKISGSQRSRAPGGGSKPVLRELEDILFDQVLYLRSNKEKVSRQWVQKTARAMTASNLHTPDFAVSDKRLAGFMARFGLSLRRTTNLTVLNDEELTGRAVSYMAFLSGLEATINPSRVVLMDETAVYFEDPKRQTVDLTGVRHVVLSSTGFASMRVTVVFAVSALEKKLTSLVIWKGVNQGSKMQEIGTVYAMFQERAWADCDVLSEWIDMVFPTVLDHGKENFLVWDSMRAHISKAIKPKCEAKGAGMCVIPSGIPSYLQAGDIGIYSSFKEKLSSFINTWNCSDQVDYTRGSNRRPPTIETVASWAALARKDVPNTVVQKSAATIGFSDETTQRHIARHDVYGDLFCMKWLDRERHDVDHTLLDQSLIDTVDEFTIEDYL